jgi:predicted transcriptional regulator
MKHRCRLDIFAAMLRAAEEEAVKTRIMHLAFVSSNQMQEYLDVLLEGGLIAVSNGSSYQTTEKGKRFLTLYHELEGSVFWKNAVSAQVAR